MQGTSAFPLGNDVLRDFQFGCTGGSRADASGSHRTGRKEKLHQDNGKKPKCAKFYRNHFWRCERKAIKGCTARIVPNHSAFRKRNAAGSEAFALGPAPQRLAASGREVRTCEPLDITPRVKRQRSAG